MLSPGHDSILTGFCVRTIVSIFSLTRQRPVLPSLAVLEELDSLKHRSDHWLVCEKLPTFSCSQSYASVSHMEMIMCPPDGTRWTAIWSSVILGVSMRACLDEISCIPVDCPLPKGVSPSQVDACVGHKG